jgi:NAD(P)-dependent dehydrogenase (short-subunit alcohol dehydrogenase family)
MGRLDGRVAVTTGASCGQEYDIAPGLAAAVTDGARAAEHTGDLPGSVTATIEEIPAAGGMAEPFVSDMRREDDLVALVRRHPGASEPDRRAAQQRRADDARQSVHPAVRPRSGAATRIAGLLDYPSRGCQRVFEVRIWSAYRLMQLVLPETVRAGRGSFMNVDAPHFPDGGRGSTAGRLHLELPASGRAGGGGFGLGSDLDADHATGREA